MLFLMRRRVVVRHFLRSAMRSAPVQPSAVFPSPMWICPRQKEVAFPFHSSHEPFQHLPSSTSFRKPDSKKVTASTSCAARSRAPLP